MPTSRFNQHFPGYEILSEIAVSNARVLKARNQYTGELVAIKHFAFNTDADTIQRFQRESEIMTSIENPFVVKINDVHLDADLPYIVMEFIDGGDLRSLLKSRKHLDVATTIQLGLQMAEAFKAIHEKGVIHRDIKPENIMYRRLQNGQLHFLLTDFGVAKIREQQVTLTGQAMMTYEYASPEQFDDPKHISVATDYYSLGVVLYECLTGGVPFKLVEGRVHTLMNQVMSSAPPEIKLPLQQALPPSLKLLINSMLAKIPGNRTSDTVVLKRMLKKADMEDTEGITETPAASPAGITEKAPVQKQQVNPQPVVSQPTIKNRSSGSFTVIAMIVFLFLFIIAASVYISNKSEPSNPGSFDSTVFTHPDTVTAKQPLLDSFKSSVDTTLFDDAVKLENGTFLDDFTDNKNLWGLNSDTNVERAIRDGKYIINAHSDDYSYGSQIKFGIDPEKDFSISLNAKWIYGITNNGFGIDFCCEMNPQQIYSFTISADGSYQVSRLTNSTWYNLVSWTQSAYINKNDALNVLAITKTGKLMKFFINDEEVTSLELTGSIGKYFGVRVFGKQTVEFDNFILKGQR